MADVKEFIEKYLPRIWPPPISTVICHPWSAILLQETAMNTISLPFTRTKQDLATQLNIYAPSLLM